MAEAMEQAGWSAGAPGALYERLRPGPGRPRLEVSSHQRTRLRGAMIEIAAEQGYQAVTVRKLARLASVSTGSFYKHFGEKERCFLSTYEGLVRRAARRAIESQRSGWDWREQLRLGLGTLARELAAEPKAARLVLIEAFAVGPAAQEQISHAEAIFEAVVRAALVQAPKHEAPSPLLARAIVAGATRVARVHLLSGRAEQLPGAVDELLDWALSYSCEVVDGEPPEPAPPLPPDPRLEAGMKGRCESMPGDERALILAAAAKLAAVDGYGSLSPPRIRAAAGVSRKSFDRHFGDVEGCFLAAVERLATEALGAAVREGAGAPTWPARVHRSVSALCARLAGDRQLAQLAFVETLAPGPAGVRQRERLVEAAAERFRRSAPPGRRPSRLSAEASVGAVWDTIHHHHVVAGWAGGLPQQATTLTFLLLAPPIGGAGATRAIHAEDERTSQYQCRGV
jgi:AcrR family transcriptional regulator